MNSISIFQLLSRSKNLLFIVFALLLLVFSILSWIVESRYQDFLNNHQELSQLSLRGVANEIQQYIHHSRQLANILVDDHIDVIRNFAKNPDDPVLSLQLDKSIKKFFPEALNYTIANVLRKPFFKDSQFFIGQQCLDDIKKALSTGSNPNELLIHANPNIQEYHFDIFAEINDLYDGKKGVFFVSLNTLNLQRMMKNGEPAHHQFFIIRKDKSSLIEMTSDSTREKLLREENLQEDEINNIIASVDIGGTRSQLIDILTTDFKLKIYYNLLRDAFIMGSVFLFFSIIFIIIVLLHERKRFIAEIEIQSLNTSLESRVEKHTEDLHQSKSKLNFQAIHDPLTNLINRHEFEYLLEGLIVKAKIASVQSVIVYMDLDQFRVINDTVGHSAGDELLLQVASLLKSQLRQSDTLARLGGDEFGILLENCPIKKAQSIVELIQEKINAVSFEWGDKIFHICISIGIMSIDSDTADTTEVMSCVDSSCYAAKAKGRNFIHVYAPGDVHLESHRNQMYWATEAIQAIESQRTVLFCQLINPINAENKMPWYEILVRIKDQDDQLVYPDTFIPALEYYGGIEQLDLVVLSGTLKFMSEHPNIIFNVNISGSSVGNINFHKKVETLLSEYAVNPAHIVFEITETAMVLNLDVAKKFIATMKELGCRIALDDFGSGMSSFGLLQSLDVDYIKLDGLFVKDIHEDPVHLSMVSAINTVSQVMGKSTIAEFVENSEISDLLKEIGISYGQGYYYHQPELLSKDVLYDS